MAQLCRNILKSISTPLFRPNYQLTCIVARAFKTSPTVGASFDPELKAKGFLGRQGPQKWLKYNDIVYPPRKEGEPARPAEITHMRTNVKYSPDNMAFIATMIRGMSIDEALKQLSFHKRKGAQVISEVLLEAQEMAVRDHNVEFKSNLWVESSHATKGIVIKGVRKHAKRRFGEVRYKFCHYFVRLREGRPPKHYLPPPMTGYEKMEEYIREQRARRIAFSL
ncbi:hypothetical protein ACJMK2_031821 [Sinanodonta woodiana]|uniref:Large ribosomal subunit protein uL22m n=1 Tax=Sinanodonta woodiana TaxID=1069815 RepID=A0ABD3WZY0_SINWO